MLSEAERTGRAEAKVEKQRLAREAKAAKRQANKDAWITHPANANAAWIERQIELKATVPLPIEPIETADNGALGRLRAIMADQEQPLYRRIEAAETVLQYELAPASLASGPSTGEVAAGSLRFLRAAIDLPDTPDALRFRALRCVAAIENARAARVDGDTLAVKRELLLALVNAERRRSLIECGSWPPSAAGWSLSLADAVEWPEGWPGSWQWPPGDFGERLDAAKLRPPAERQADREAFRSKLRAVRATNRVDAWQAGVGAEHDSRRA